MNKKIRVNDFDSSRRNRLIRKRITNESLEDAVYHGKVYYGKNYSGLDYDFETDFFNDLKEKVWEGISKCGYVEVSGPDGTARLELPENSEFYDYIDPDDCVVWCSKYGKCRQGEVSLYDAIGVENSKYESFKRRRALHSLHEGLKDSIGYFLETQVEKGNIEPDQIVSIYKNGQVMWLGKADNAPSYLNNIGFESAGYYEKYPHELLINAPKYTRKFNECIIKSKSYRRRLHEQDVEIEVKHEGVLEVPEGKNVDDLPIYHFVDLAKKKGLSTVTRALNNLQVWNKNKNPELSKWAVDMIDKVTKRIENQEKKESNIRKNYKSKLIEGTKGFISPFDAAEYYYDSWSNGFISNEEIRKALKNGFYDDDFIDEVFIHISDLADEEAAYECEHDYYDD